MPKKIRVEDMGIEGAWDEGCFTEALLLYDEDAKDFAERFTKLVDRAEETRLGQLKCWRRETIAQAHASLRRYLLARLTERLHRTLTRLLEDSGSSEPTQELRYKLYFTEHLSQLAGRGLESQLQK